MSEAEILWIGTIDPDDDEGPCRMRVMTSGEARDVSVELTGSNGKWHSASDWYVRELTAHLATRLRALEAAAQRALDGSWEDMRHDQPTGHRVIDGDDAAALAALLPTSQGKP